MVGDMVAIEANKTWERTSLPHNKHPFRCKWVFKINYDLDGSIKIYKAQLVAKGYTQQEGLDYLNNFSSLVKLNTVLCLLAVVAINKCNLHKLDVNNVFFMVH